MAAAAAVRVQEAHPGIDVRIPPRPVCRLQEREVDAAIRTAAATARPARDWLMAASCFRSAAAALLTGDKPLRCPEYSNFTLLHSIGGYDDDWRLWLTAAGCRRIFPNSPASPST